ncbi:hypothetical protein [Phaeocystidibacter marisrubri]|uniref:Uncharacterized protein n=1 Tax=Phaeocystidibacter marisrubri TaxID=1577780 RepID=A0A6L3ZE93_9FLAO|nr:hypothetical protein [Phaeocystidibacter marisrubri]KAB2816151.1 hypothetical protein F8C82_10715 [Phaeocystidibacter marisrubri]GGH67591.1 hypothetical protein GCM10011318_06720 [Phaeocystidibacter marisrubri]
MYAFTDILEMAFYITDRFIRTVLSGAFFWNVIALLGRSKPRIQKLDKGFSKVIITSGIAYASLVLISVIYLNLVRELAYHGHAGYFSSDFLYYWGIVFTTVVLGRQLFRVKALKQSVFYRFMYSFAVLFLLNIDRFIISFSSFHRDFIGPDYTWIILGPIAFILLSTISFIATLWIVRLMKSNDLEMETLD